MKFWDEIRLRYKEKEKIWTKTTQEHYDEMLGCVPPVAQKHDSFLLGEPETHNSKGEAIYACFRLKEGIYSARFMTLQEFSS